MKSKSFVVLLMLLSSNALAMFCPSNFNQVDFGDTIDKVKLFCGPPDVEKKSEREPNVPQEWNYYVRPDPTNEGTLKMSIAFVDNKAVNITVNNQSLISTPMCGNSINTGDTQESIQAACGKPVFINKGNTAKSSPPPIQVNEFIYNSSPPVTLIFENGYLKEKK